MGANTEKMVHYRLSGSTVFFERAAEVTIVASTRAPSASLTLIP